jgi:hypothetical protein
MKISKIPFSYNFTLSHLSFLSGKAKLSVTQHLLPPQKSNTRIKKKKSNTMARGRALVHADHGAGAELELRVQAGRHGLHCRAELALTPSSIPACVFTFCPPSLSSQVSTLPYPSSPMSLSPSTIVVYPDRVTLSTLLLL